MKMDEDGDMEYGDEVEEEEEEEEEDDEEDNSAGQVNGIKSAMNGYSKGFGAGARGW